MRWRSPLRSTVSGSKFAVSSTTDVVESRDLGVLAAHHAGEADRLARASAITRSAGSSVRLVPSSVTSSSPGRARRTMISPPTSVSRVVGVQRAAEREHHVVGDVDDVRDRAHPRSRSAAPSARRATRRASRRGRTRAMKRGHASRSSIVDRERLVAVARRVRARRPRHRLRARRRSAPPPRARSRRSTSGRAGCRASRSRARRRRAAARRRAASRPRGRPTSTMIPPWSVPSSSSRSDRIIPSETSPRSLRFSIVNSPPGITRAGSDDGDRRAGAEVPRAADDRPRLAVADVDLRQLELVGVRMLAGLEHLADDEVAVGCRRRRTRRAARCGRPRSS